MINADFWSYSAHNSALITVSMGTTWDVMEHSDDGRYVVVDGRRWRATDPSVPEAFRAELVAELMAARRAVQTDPATARARVQDAKVALGERGRPWWQEPTEVSLQERLAATIRALLRHRDPDRTICPSDAARAVGGSSWRTRMDAARAVAAELHDAGIVRVQQRGADVDPRTARGPVRIARGPQFFVRAGPASGH